MRHRRFSPGSGSHLDGELDDGTTDDTPHFPQCHDKVARTAAARRRIHLVEGLCVRSQPRTILSATNSLTVPGAPERVPAWKGSAIFQVFLFLAQRARTLPLHDTTSLDSDFEPISGAFARARA